MKIESFDIEATIEKTRALIDQDEQMSAATKSMFEVLILLINNHDDTKPAQIWKLTGLVFSTFFGKKRFAGHCQNLGNLYKLHR